jgi:exoribonuclease II
MTSPHPRDHRSDLERVARQAMLARGLLPDFDPAALKQLAAMHSPPRPSGSAIRDLSASLWCSIDNDDSRDLDQLTVCEDAEQGGIKLLVAVADVDTLVEKSTPIDKHAANNTTSVYTPARVFPMLPERLSTDLTSLNPDADRQSVVVEYIVKEDGTLGASAVYRALVRNKAKLAYNSVAAWLDGKAAMPAPVAAVPGMEAQLRRQDEAAARLRRARDLRGAPDFESLESRPVFEGNTLVNLKADVPNRAKSLIAEAMIAANGVVARFLEGKGRASLRRVVRSPERWEKIVAVAKDYGESLPAEPSAAALGAFLLKRRAADPLRFPDLSLVIVKLMGRGEYAVDVPGSAPVGHFGLAVEDYTHATAPNRRFPDLITQRLLKAALADASAPYDAGELSALATHCNVQEENATKVERQVKKSAAALLLTGRIGQIFDGIITGASGKGTYARIFDPPVEGRVVHNEAGLKVGDTVKVKLTGTDFERGWLDFVSVGHSGINPAHATRA